MNIATIRYFLEVIETGSVRRAAERLNVSASAISRQLQNIEREFGTELFERASRGMTLTEEGRALGLHLRRVSREISLAQDELANIRGLRRGTVSFATIEGVVHPWIFPAVAEFRRSHPGVTFNGRILSTDEVHDAIVQDRVDFGVAIDVLAPADDAEAISVKDAFATRYVIAAGERHPLAALREIGLADLRRHDLALLNRSFQTTSHLLAHLSARGLTMRSVIELNQIDALISYVSMTEAVAVLPDYAITKLNQMPGVIFRMIDAEELPPCKTVLIVNARRRMTSATAAFLDRLRMRRLTSRFGVE